MDQLWEAVRTGLIFRIREMPIASFMTECRKQPTL